MRFSLLAVLLLSLWGFYWMPSLRLLSWNASGLRAKVDELKAALMLSLSDVCCIQETLFNAASVPDTQPSTPGFHRLRKDGEDGQNGGGLLTRTADKSAPIAAMEMEVHIPPLTLQRFFKAVCRTEAARCLPEEHILHQTFRDLDFEHQASPTPRLSSQPSLVSATAQQASTLPQ